MYNLISYIPTHNLEMFGGSTESVFTKTEEKLHNMKYQEVIGYFVNKHPKLSSDYRSMIDFIFCEYFTGWKKNVSLFIGEKVNRLKKNYQYVKLISMIIF